MLGWRKAQVDVDLLIARGRLRPAARELRRLATAQPDNPHLALRLADVLARDGRNDEAVAVLEPLADRFARDGFLAKAVAVLKKIERLDPEHAEATEGLIASLSEAGPAGRDEQAAKGDRAPEPGKRVMPRVPPKTSELRLPEDWFADARKRQEGVSLSPLFADLSQRQLESMIGELQLLVKHPGAIVFSQGEPGASLFVLATGSARVYVRDAGGKNRQIGIVEDGAFFGATSLVQGTPRSATIVAASTCELLELGRDAYDRIGRAHPEVRVRVAAYVAEHREHGAIV